jgi:heme/copper-type cytochrome/quinol oxidase subunit 2
MMYLAVIGAAALWLTFVWLGSAIVASLFSEAKGYGEKVGLVTGIMFSVLGAFVWAVWPPREISRRRMQGGLSGPARTTLIVVEVILVAAAAYFVTSIYASGGGRIGLAAVALMVMVIAAAFVYTIDIQRATGGKTMAELRTERAAD